MGYNILKYFHAARAINNTIHKKSQLDIASPLGGDVEEIGYFDGRKIHLNTFTLYHFGAKSETSHAWLHVVVQFVARLFERK